MTASMAVVPHSQKVVVFVKLRYGEKSWWKFILGLVNVSEGLFFKFVFVFLFFFVVFGE